MSGYRPVTCFSQALTSSSIPNSCGWDCTRPLPYESEGVTTKISSTNNQHQSNSPVQELYGKQIMTSYYRPPLEMPTNPVVLPGSKHPVHSNVTSFVSDSDIYPDNCFQSTYFNSSLSGNNDISLAKNPPIRINPDNEPDTLGTCRPGGTLDTNDTMYGSPRKEFISSLDNLRTSSLYEDPENFGFNADCQPLAPAEELPIRHDWPQAKATPPKRKPGRQRLIHLDNGSSYSESKSRKAHLSKRQPHTEIERKYRQGLNAEFERLRMAIPTHSHRDLELLHSSPKPSKAAVLASAIDYIHKLELELDRLKRENDILRAGKRTTGQSMKVNGSHRLSLAKIKRMM